MSVVLRADRLRKSYPPKKKYQSPIIAVDKVSFELREGEVLGLLGPNGAGKSTIISMLLGVLTPTSGSVKVFGNDLKTHRTDVLQHMTFASTYVKMPWRLTVMENLRVFALFYGLRKKEFTVRAEHFLNYFGVWDHRNKTMNELSAGQVTRVMLAKAFIPHPKIVLLDEPTASLDPDIAHKVRSFVLEQQKTHHTSIVYTSHNMDEVSEVCDRVIFLQKGNIVAEDRPENLARSISDSTMRLTVPNAAHRDAVLRLAHERGLVADAEQKELVITIEEDQIAPFLTAVGEQGVHYSHIVVEQPTLEEYFLQMSKEQ